MQIAIVSPQPEFRNVHHERGPREAPLNPAPSFQREAVAKEFMEPPVHT